jgi:hypothetical protein
MRAEAAGDPGPWRQQAILGRGRWNADDVRDIVRDYALETLADDDAVLVIDETGFLKQGKASCGVSRQYTGSAGKITNCQVGVFACYVSRHGHSFIDRALYLPKAWTDDPARMKAVHVPAQTRFATKPAMAGAMIERALAAKTPFGWVAADSVYGVGSLETTLRQAGTMRIPLGRMADTEISRFPYKELPYMPGSATTPDQADARDCAPARIAFRSVDSVGARDNILSRLNGWPVCSPTDASPTPSRMPAHGSGPMWLATPSS